MTANPRRPILTLRAFFLVGLRHIGTGQQPEAYAKKQVVAHPPLVRRNTKSIGDMANCVAQLAITVESQTTSQA